MVGQGAPHRSVTIGAQAFGVDAAGAFPIEVDTAPGALFTLRFAQAAAGGAALDWGGLLNQMQRMSVLDLAGVRVQRPGEADRIYVCGASPGAVAWRTTDVERLPCQRTLRLKRLTLSPDGGQAGRHGLWLRRGRGKPRVLSWKTWAENPLIGLGEDRLLRPRRVDHQDAARQAHRDAVAGPDADAGAPQSPPARDSAIRHRPRPRLTPSGPRPQLAARPFPA